MKSPVTLRSCLTAFVCILMCIHSAAFSESNTPELTIKKSNLAVLDKRYHDEVDAAGILLKDTTLITAVESVVRKLEHAMNEKNIISRIKVIDAAAPNAFAFSDGAIYINIAILGMIHNEAQLAFLLAHEMAHITREHQIGMHYEMIAQSSAQVYNQMFFSIFGIHIGAGSFVRHALGGFSRTQEHEADSIACSTLFRAGYNVWEARKFMLTMYRWLAYRENDRKYKGPKTHPKIRHRYKHTTRWASSLQPDSTTGLINVSWYQRIASPHYQHIIDLLYKSNSVFELTEMINARFSARDSSGAWLAIYGTLLEKYSPIDSFHLATTLLKKAIGDSASAAVSLKTLGWLFLKNNMRDSARIYLSRHLTRVPDSKDAPIVQFYLDQLK